MRVRKKAGGVTVFAVAGTYVVHLGLDITAAGRRGLLGFSLSRQDMTALEAEPRWLPNSRTFAGRAGDARSWPTNEAPLQKFRWGDYTAGPGRHYVYRVRPVYGRPGALEPGDEVEVAVTTEDAGNIPDGSGGVHQVHFSRGAAASQAYVRRFGETKPDDVPGGAALKWLSRGLLEGLIAFVDDAGPADELHACVYEFQYPAVLAAFKRAKSRGVTVRVLYDAGTGTSAPAERNGDAVASVAGLGPVCKPRKGLRSYISHHKFIVRVRAGTPEAVWTGSTNMTRNALYAQLNVGHAVFDRGLAGSFLALHKKLWDDDPRAEPTRTFIEGVQPSVRLPAGSHRAAVFSPRNTEEAMEYYVDLMASARRQVVLTTPFGVDERIVSRLETSPPEVLSFGMVGHRGTAAGGKVTRIDGIDGTRYTMPARIDSTLDRWQVEQFAGFSHAYIHTKFLLVDPLSDAPTLVTGSANFSSASCKNNDENMLVLAGCPAVADVYLTEFFRLFEHYGFRHFVEANRNRPVRLALDETDGWTAKYFVDGSERQRDRALFSGG